MLTWDDKVAQRVAERKLSTLQLGKLVVLQALTEQRLRFLKGVNFRKRANEEAVDAYARMGIQEFEGINARQAWANWRTIPKALNGLLPNQPLKVVDLCCGTGQSTEVLSWFLHPGSQILGLEYNPAFVEKARKKRFLHSSGTPVSAGFNPQSVLETFRDEEGEPVAEASIDLVSCSGAVGHHFAPQATRVLGREIARVLKTGGIASLDSGSAGTNLRELIRIFEDLGFSLVRTRKSCAVDLYTQACFRKN